MVPDCGTFANGSVYNSRLLKVYVMLRGYDDLCILDYDIYRLSEEE